MPDKKQFERVVTRHWMSHLQARSLLAATCDNDRDRIVAADSTPAISGVLRDVIVNIRIQKPQTNDETKEQ